MEHPRESIAKNIGMIVLAAGSSRRMNAPKQLLSFQGKTLLRRAAETALASVYRPVAVVLGANFELSQAEIADLPIEIVYNRDWQSGLSTSIKTGIEKLQQIAPDLAAVVVALADQPFVTAEHLNRFAERFEATENPVVVAAEYNGTRGVPALFSRDVFDDLRRLSGDRGAKPVIEKHRGSLSTIALPEAAFDIDTPSDLGLLISDFGS